MSTRVLILRWCANEKQECVQSWIDPTYRHTRAREHTRNNKSRWKKGNGDKKAKPEFALEERDSVRVVSRQQVVFVCVWMSIRVREASVQKGRAIRLSQPMTSRSKQTRPNSKARKWTKKIFSILLFVFSIFFFSSSLFAPLPSPPRSPSTKQSYPRNNKHTQNKHKALFLFTHYKQHYNKKESIFLLLFTHSHSFNYSDHTLLKNVKAPWVVSCSLPWPLMGYCNPRDHSPYMFNVQTKPLFLHWSDPWRQFSCETKKKKNLFTNPSSIRHNCNRLYHFFSHSFPSKFRFWLSSSPHLLCVQVPTSTLAPPSSSPLSCPSFPSPAADSIATPQRFIFDIIFFNSPFLFSFNKKKLHPLFFLKKVPSKNILFCYLEHKSTRLPTLSSFLLLNR